MKQAGLLINGSTPENIINLNLILEDASIGDAFHDFNGSDVAVSYDNILPGLPGSVKTSKTFNKISEETVLKSAFKSDIPENITIPLKMADPEGGKAIDITPSVDTINGHKYKITRINVKNKDVRITANEFFQMGGFYTGDGPTQKNIALIIDCVSIKFMEMLKNGDKLAEFFKVFLLKAPEIENDPGGKTKISDKIFSESKGVYLKPAVPLDLNNGDVNKDKSYIYNYNDRDSTSNNLYAGFYSKYTFELSELILKKKFIFENLSTTLTITDNSPDTITIGSKIVENSGSNNEITALVKFINSIKDLFKTKNEEKKLTFNINASFQQKRSGDWFQALLAALVTNNKRDFSEYKKDGANNTKIPFESTDVYLVTHDRILLAFALLLGINVIFTHKKPKDDKSTPPAPSLHSAVIYRINNPAQLAEQNAKILENFKATHAKIEAEIKKSRTDLAQIKEKFDMQNMITTETSIINMNIERIKAMITAKKINTAEINDCTQSIFASIFILNLLETQKPKEIQELIESYTMLALPPLDETDDKLINKFNALYSELRNKKDIFVKKTSDVTTLSFGESINKQLKKSQPYTFIKKWEWLGSTKFNIVEDDIIFMVTNTKSKKKNDKNIFLAELNRVSSADIKKISDVYLQLYDFILANQVAANYVDKKGIPLDGRMVAKFKDKMTSFCIEVLINLNPLNSIAYNNQDKIKKYITDYKTLLISAGSTEAEVNRFEQKELISEYEEIKTMPMLDDSVINVESVVPIPMLSGQQQQGGSLIKGGVYTFNYNDKENLKMLLAIFLFSYNLEISNFEEALAVLESTSGGGDPNPETLRSNDSGIETASESRPGALLVAPTAATGALSVENTQQPVASPVQQQEPIFANTSYGFHPLLPIFLILESYYTQLLEVDDEIWDSDLYLKFYQILKSLINNLLKIYNDNKPGHKLQAIYLGYGLRELLFTSNQYSERSELEKNILELEEKDYNYFSLLSSMFSNGVCGNIVYDESDVKNGTKYIDNELFKNYLKTVDIKTIMEAPEAEIPIEDLRKLTKILSMNISKKMLADISDSEASELFTLTSQKEAMSTPMPTTQISAPPEPVPEPVSLPEISVTNNMLLKNLSPSLINKYKSRMTTRRLSNNLTRMVGGSKKRTLKTYKKTHKKAQKNLKKNKGTHKKQKLRYKKYTKRRNTKNKK